MVQRLYNETHRIISTEKGQEYSAQGPLSCPYISLSWIWLLVLIVPLSPFKSDVCYVLSGFIWNYTFSHLISKFHSASRLTWPACISVFFQLPQTIHRTLAWHKNKLTHTVILNSRIGQLKKIISGYIRNLLHSTCLGEPLLSWILASLILCEFSYKSQPFQSGRNLTDSNVRYLSFYRW